MKTCAILIVVFVSMAAGGWKRRKGPSSEKTGAKSDWAAFDNIINANKNIDLKKAGISTFSTKQEQSSFDLFEGDIVVTKKLKKLLHKRKFNPKAEDSPFDAITNGQWAKAVVPYTFAAGFRYKTVVDQAIREYKRKTCIVFRPYRRGDRNYVQFMHGGGCYSMIGRQGGRQQISLGNGCNNVGVAIHEMMHALGFFHEQSRRDRDSYITIYFNNIRRSMWYNFEKYKRGQASTLGFGYDKQSVMHYGNYAFSTNGRKTIVSRSNPNERLGQRSGLSRIDVQQLNKYYRCSGSEKITTTTTTRPKTTTTTRAPPKGCKDNYRFCSLLAKNNLCSSNIVKTNCKKSCKDDSCQVKKKCVDKNSNCKAWSEWNRYCRYKTGCCKNGSYVSYMRDNCKNSCGFSC